MNRPIYCTTILAIATCAPAQEPAARTVQVHSQDIVPIRAKVKYTTLIEVPGTEKIMEAATGDKEFWVVDVLAISASSTPQSLASPPISTLSPTRETSTVSRCKTYRKPRPRRT